METLKGYVDNFIFRNADNGYAVLELVSGSERITCTGIFGNTDEGEFLEMEGEYAQVPPYGRQFKMQQVKVSVPNDTTSIQRYLGSGAIIGIGEALAARIVKTFGDDTYRIVTQEPERLEEVKGISARKARDIANQMEEKRELRDAMIFMQGYGITNNLAVKIYNKYGNRIYTILKENPYQLADDIGGIGFKKADEIASRVGIRVDSDYRIKSGLMYSIAEAAAEGNTYLPKNEVITNTLRLLALPNGEGASADNVETQIANLMMDKKLICKNGDQIFAAPYYYEENACAVMLNELNVRDPQMSGGDSQDDLLDQIEQLEIKKGMELDDLQRQAVAASITNGIVIITGGPGTGKTTTINMIISYYESQGLDLLLAAPTGRAAKRMTEATGYEARTVHRLLEVSGRVDDDDAGKEHTSFERNQDNPLEADAVIIDEMSMVDIHLFTALLKAIAPGTHLILVGDSSQLPSVGPGQVLRDLMDSGKFATIVLQKIFRQAEESDIVMNAHGINRGERIKLDNKSKDFFFLARDNVNAIYKHMVLLIRDKLPGYVHAQPFDIQVLTPMRKGALGAEQLNKILQSQLNPEQPGKEEYLYKDTTFRTGDKVMQIKNNYQMEWEITGKYDIKVDGGTGVFNGDVGTIVSIDKYNREMVIEFDEHRKARYPFEQLDEIELAYAITIHKSQGSEYPAVVMPLLGGPKMLMNRNLLYTAVTRAKSCVTILGSEDTINEMIANSSQLRRYTGLKERIEDIYKIQTSN